MSSCSFQPKVGDGVKFKKVKDKRHGNFTASDVIETSDYVDPDYFDLKKTRKRREFRKKFKEHNYWSKREIKNSEHFKETYFWIEKEGYHCSRCHRKIENLDIRCNYCDFYYWIQNYKLLKLK